MFVIGKNLLYSIYSLNIELIMTSNKVENVDFSGIRYPIQSINE